MTTKQPAAKALIIGSAELKKEGEAITKAAGNMATRVQHFLISAAVHAHQHNDAEALLNVLNMPSKALRMNAMKEWAVRFAPIALNGQGKLIFSRPYENDDEESRSAAIENAVESPAWDSLKPEAPFVPFDLDKAMLKLLKRAEEALADTEHAGQNKVSPEKLAKIKLALQ